MKNIHLDTGLTPLIWAVSAALMFAGRGGDGGQRATYPYDEPGVGAGVGIRCTGENPCRRPDRSVVGRVFGRD